MRSRKELIYLNIKNLTQEEIEKLSDYDLAYCDICGEIELSEKLNWIDNESYKNNKYCMKLLVSGKITVCDVCFDKKKI